MSFPIGTQTTQTHEEVKKSSGQLIDNRLQGDIKSEMEGTILKCEEFWLDEALSVVIECYHEL